MTPRRPGADPSRERAADTNSLEGALQRFAATRPRLVVLDFDGTLAPLVDDPATSRMTPLARTALRSLVAAPDVTVALLSGRAMADLRSVAQPPPGIVLVASHGAEVEGAADAVQGPTRELLSRVRGELEQLAAEHPGTRVEVKPAGVVLHTRQAAPDTAASATSSALDGPGSHEGVTAMRGKDVVELSVVDTDKGSAIELLREQTGAAAVLFAGDDVTDEHAFARLWPANGDIGIKVGDGETAAGFRVGSCDEMASLLDDLVDLLSRPRP